MVVTTILYTHIKARSHSTSRLNQVQKVLKICWTWWSVVSFCKFWLGRALYEIWDWATVPLLKNWLSKANHVQPRACTRKSIIASDKLQNTHYFPWYQRVTPVRWPCSTSDRPLNFCVLRPGHTALYGLITAKTRQKVIFREADDVVRVGVEFGTSYTVDL